MRNEAIKAEKAVAKFFSNGIKPETDCVSSIVRMPYILIESENMRFLKKELILWKIELERNG